MRNDTPHSLMSLSLCSISPSAFAYTLALVIDAPTSAWLKTQRLTKDVYTHLTIDPIQESHNRTYVWNYYTDVEKGFM